MSISSRGPANPSTTTFPNISLKKKQLESYFLFQKSIKNGCNNVSRLSAIMCVEYQSE